MECGSFAAADRFGRGGRVEHAAALFQKVHEAQVYPVMSERIGHRDLLRDVRSVVLEASDGVECVRTVV